MNWVIPGTVLTAERSEADAIPGTFHSMFLAGDMVLGQVSSISGLEPYIIQNWVKRGFLSKPRCKKYSMNQLCRILNINMLKGALPMERICGLLTYINGQLDDESDDLIDDAELYFMFVRLAAGARELESGDAWQGAIDAVLEGYAEKAPGAKARIRKVLQVMLTAWISTRMRQEAEKMLAEMDEPRKESI